MDQNPHNPTNADEPVAAAPRMVPEHPATAPQPLTQLSPTLKDPKTHELFLKINRVTALILVISAVLFAAISMLSIWEALGPDSGEIVWRSLMSLATIAFAALIVNVATKLIDQRR